MGWQTELLRVVGEVPWRGTNYYSYHEYFLTEWSPTCQEAFLLFRNAIKEHGDDRPFVARLRDGSTREYQWTYLDLDGYTYWCGRNWWLKDTFVVDPNVVYGINRKPAGTA